MEEPDPGQRKAVVDLTNGKQEKTVEVEVIMLVENTSLVERHFIAMVGSEVPILHILGADGNLSSHRNQLPAMPAALPATTHYRSLLPWLKDSTTPSSALPMVPRPCLSHMPLPLSQYGRLPTAFLDKWHCQGRVQLR